MLQPPYGTLSANKFPKTKIASQTQIQNITPCWAAKNMSTGDPIINPNARPCT
jgi:hypothetical protein